MQTLGSSLSATFPTHPQRPLLSPWPFLTPFAAAERTSFLMICISTLSLQTQFVLISNIGFFMFARNLFACVCTVLQTVLLSGRKGQQRDVMPSLQRWDGWFQPVVFGCCLRTPGKTTTKKNMTKPTKQICFKNLKPTSHLTYEIPLLIPSKRPLISLNNTVQKPLQTHGKHLYKMKHHHETTKETYYII